MAQSNRLAAWVGATVVLTGLIVFLSLGSPEAGDATDPTAASPQITSLAVDRSASPSRTTLPCTTADQPANFKLFGLGSRFEDLPLTAIRRECDRASGNGRANFVSFIYGTCAELTAVELQQEGGCPAPLEVQIWPSCERSFSDYDFDLIDEPTVVSLRGVPAVVMPGRVELYSADATVVVFAESTKLSKRASDAVTPVDRSVTPVQANTMVEDTRSLAAGDLPVPTANVTSVRPDCRDGAGVK